MNLRRGKANSERVEQAPELRLVDLAVSVFVDALEALSQRVLHGSRLRGFLRFTNGIGFAALSLLSCRAAPEAEPRPPALQSADAAPRAELHPAAPPAPASLQELAPLRGEWLERLTGAPHPIFVAPPIGATAPRPLIIAVHGAGDRPEWSCGGWRLAAQASAFVACPQGSAMTTEKFAWASPAVLTERVENALEQVRARYRPYLDGGPVVFAGFSQGATYAEPLLRKHAARFPIVILAEGGYAIARSPAFAAAFREGGGRRVVLVCGNPGCFATANQAKKVLLRAGLEAMVVGDPKAGHNLNERMQKALQAAWPDITAPLSGR